MMLTEGNICTIIYHSDRTDRTSSRTIVPTSVPNDSVKAIDVTDLPPTQRLHMAKLASEYQQYVALQQARMFTFEDWAAHTHDEHVEPTWRTFKLSGLK